MIKQLLFAVSCFTVLVLTGCQNCTSCDYDFDYVLYDGEGLILDEGNQNQGGPEEYCGNGTTVDNYELGFESFVEGEIQSFEDLGYIVTVNKSGCDRE
ncbi:MAG: hypothetical protein ACKVPJ_02055 [Chitinophagales bacterium]